MYRIYLISTYHCPPAQCDIHRGRDQMTKLFSDHWTSLDVTWSYLISRFSKTFTDASIRDLNNNSIWNWTNTHIDPNIILLRKTVSQETPVCRLPGYWGQVGGCRMPRKQTNYGNPTHQPKVMFTFGVNSVCACALAYLCVDIDPLGKSLTLEPVCVSTGYLPTWGNIKNRDAKQKCQKSLRNPFENAIKGFHGCQ